jgi:hypothetical protein
MPAGYGVFGTGVMYGLLADGHPVQLRVENSAHAPPYGGGTTGTWLVMICWSLAMASFCTVVLPVPSYWSSAAWAALSENRPKSPVAGFPTGALSLLSSHPE